MKIKFKQFYQGVLTYPHAYDDGQIVDLPDEQAKALILEGRAEKLAERKPAPKPRKPAKPATKTMSVVGK